MLLVAVIISMMAAIATPIFVRSIKGARLRTSVRTITAVNKYARTIAVLKQQRVAVVYFKERGRVELRPMDKKVTEDYFLEDRPQISIDNEEDEDGEKKKGQLSFQATTVRKLEDKIRIEDFEGVEEQEDDAVYWIYYYPNGMCDGHEFRLVDHRDRGVEFEVQNITGDIKIEYENF